ncbi:MAG: NfeD family protein [Hominimerdicola sp.]
MNEWWEGLSALLKVLYCIAVPSTLILLIQTLMSMFGFHDGGGGHDISDTSGLDLDMDIDVDVPDCNHDMGSDFNLDGGNSADFASMRMFTLQTVVTFLTVFSWSAIVMVNSGVPAVLSGVIAAVLGFFTMALVAKILQLSMRLTENGTMNLKNAIGETATVYIPIPAKGEGVGKITLTVQGQFIEAFAISKESEMLKTGASVVITDLQGDNFVVEKE